MTGLRALRVVHPFPSFLVAGLTVVLALAAGGGDKPTTMVVLGIGMLLYQFSIGIANDLCDIDDDRQAKPWKPLASGAVSRRVASGALIACAGGGMALTAMLGWQSWLIGVAALAAGLTYDVWLKRTAWSWLPYAVAFPLVPAWAHVAIDAWEPYLWWAFPLGIALGFAMHLANQAPDAADEGSGLPGILGELRSRWLAIVVFVSVAITTATIAGSATAIGGAVAAALVVAAGGPLAHRVLGADGLFGLMSVAGCALAVAFIAGG